MGTKIFSKNWRKHALAQEFALIDNDVDENGFPDDITGSGDSFEEFDTSIAYSLDDVIIQAGILYRANGDIPEGTDFATGDTGATWTTVLAVNPVIADFDNSTDYAVDSLVFENGSLYRANSELAAGAFNATNWTTPTFEAFVGFNDFSTAADYHEGEAVVRSGSLWRATGDITAGAWNGGEWEGLTSSLVVAPDFVTTTDYTDQELTIHDGKLYRAIGAVNSGNWDITNWTPIATEASLVADFSTTTAYVINQLTLDQGTLYRATRAVATGNWDADDWTAVTASYRNPYQGAHSNSTNYLASDLVIHDTKFYTANGDINGNFSTTDWTEVSESTDVGPFKGDHSNAITYAESDLVIHSAKFYVANSANTSGNFSNNAWTEVSVSEDMNPFKGPHATDATYAQNDLVIHDTKFYIARAAIGTPGTFAIANWQEISPSTDVSTFKGPHATDVTYAQNEMVFTGGKLYTANSDNTSGTFASADWTELSKHPFQGTHSNAITYAAGDLVIHSTKFYTANSANTSGAFSTNEWTEVSASEDVGPYKGTFSNSIDYVQNDLIISGAKFYMAPGDIAAGAFDATDWTEISANAEALSGLATTWSSAVAYAVDSLVVVVTAGSSKLYRANSTHAAGNWAAGNWTQLNETIIIAADFEANKVYPINEVIYQDGNLYRATAAFTADGTFDTGDWTLLSTGSASSYRGAWITTNSYLQGQLVIRTNQWYIAVSNIAANVGFTVGTGNDEWTEISAADGGATTVLTWAANTSYIADQVVFHDNALYSSDGIRVSQGTWDATEAGNWTAITGADAVKHIIAADFVASTAYVANEIVLQDGNLYRANNTFTSANAFDSDNWTALSDVARNSFRGAHVQASSYLVNDIVFTNSRFYRAVSAIDADTVFAEGTTGQVWAEVSAATAAVSSGHDWVASTSYAPNQFVVVSNILYRSNANIARTSGANWDATEQGNWDAMSVNNAINHVMNPFVGGKAYVENEFIEQDSKIYKANTGFSAGGTFAIADWTEVKRDTYRGIWAIGNAVISGDLVIHEGALYRANAAAAANTAFVVGSPWDLVHSSRLATFVAGSNVIAGDLITRNNHILMANTTHTAAGSWTVGEAAAWTTLTNREIEDWTGGTDYRQGDQVSVGGAIYQAVQDTNSGTWVDGEWEIVSEVNVFKGAHVPAFAYQQSDMIILGSNLYTANNFMNAGTGATIPFVAGSGNDEWTLVVDGARGGFRGTHIPADTYAFGDLVVNAGNLYTANTAITPAANGVTNFSEGTGDDQWTLATGAVTRSIFRNTFDSAATYVSGDIIKHVGNIYSANGAMDGSTTALTFLEGTAVANWTLVNRAAYRGAHNQAHFYLAGDIVSNNDNLYTSNGTKTGPSGNVAFSIGGGATQWTLLVDGASSIFKGVHSNTATYTQGDLVFEDGEIYSANANITTAAVFSSAAWTSATGGRRTFRGAWVQADAYVAGDIVRNNGLLYAANDAIPATTNFTIGTANATWVLTGGERNTFRGAFVDTGTYLAGDTVTRNLNVFTANSAMSGATTAITWNEATGAGNWTRVLNGERTTYRGTFAALGVYLAGDKVSNAGNLYTANGAMTGTTAANLALTLGTAGATWTEVSRGVFRGPHNQAHYYLGGDVVSNDNNLYTANGAMDGTTTNVPFVAGGGGSEWTLLVDGATSIFKGEHSATGLYAQGDLVVEGNDIYTSNAAVTTGVAFAAANWTSVTGDRNTFRGAHSDTAAYLAGDYTTHDNNLWVANAAITPAANATIAHAEGTTGQTWASVSTGIRNTFRGAFATDAVYVSGDTVTHEHNYYTANDAMDGTTTALVWGVGTGDAQFTLESTGAYNTFRGLHSNTVAYLAGDYVEHGNALYRAVSDYTGAFVAGSNANEWVLLQVSVTGGNGTGQFANGQTITVSNAALTDDSIVTIYQTDLTATGNWSVESNAGNFVVTSSETEVSAGFSYSFIN